MKTAKAEQLANKIGQKIECDICHQKKVFSSDWKMSTDKIILCPECQVKNKARLMVSI